VSDSNEKALRLCTACGRPHDGQTELCPHCGAPLTAFASSDWVLGIQARGFAASQATRKPRKLIVVIGMWMWLFPMLFFGLFLGFGGAADVQEGFRGRYNEGLSPTGEVREARRRWYYVVQRCRRTDQMLILRRSDSAGCKTLPRLRLDLFLAG